MPKTVRRPTLLSRFRASRLLPLTMIATFVAPLLPSSALADPTSVPSVPAGPSGAGGQPSVGSPETGPDGANALAAANVDPQTGILHATIPFALPSARGAVQPSLALEYSSASYWGEGGQGWSLNIPSIERHNISGLPHPENDPQSAGAPIDPTKQDHFVWGGQPLIPICLIPSGEICNPITRHFPSWVGNGWHYYQLQVEDGSLAHFFWSPDRTQWVIQVPSGETSVYGVPADAPSDLSGADSDSNGHILRWNLIRRYDSQRNASGMPTNLVLYRWTKGAPGTRSFLTDIFDTPYANEAVATPPTDDFAHHVHLTYKTYAFGTFPGSLSRVATAGPYGWLTNVDVTSRDYGSGGTGANTTTRQQVRRYALGYTNDSGASSVSSVQEEGRCLQGNPSETNGLLPPAVWPPACPARPVTTFTYQSSSVAPSVVAGPSLTSSAPPLIFDINSDGLPDILEPPGTAHINAVPSGKGFTAGSFSLPSGVSNLNAATFSAGAPQLSTGEFQMDGVLDGLWANFDQVPNRIEAFGVSCVVGADGSLTNSNQPGKGHEPEPPYGDGGVFDTSPSSITYQYLVPQGAASSWNLTAPLAVTAPLQRVFQVSCTTGQANFSKTFNAILASGDERPYADIDINGDGIPDQVTSVATVRLNTDASDYWADRQLAVRLSRRDLLSGQYWPFYGTDSPAASAAPLPSTPICVGGWQAPVVDVQTNELHAPDLLTDPVTRGPARFALADMNGDGLADFVLMPTPGTYWHCDAAGICNQLTVTGGVKIWHGHGDGVFGSCRAGDTNLDCGCNDVVDAVASGGPAAASSPLAAHDVQNATFADVTGDGMADMVAVTAAGDLHVQANIGYANGETLFGSVISVALGMPGANISFADMNGSGVNDILVSKGSSSKIVDVMAGGRPGLLTDITYNSSKTVPQGTRSTHIDYASSADPAVTSFGPWTRSAPQVLHVVTAMTQGDAPAQGDHYKTLYHYKNPVFNPGTSGFLGFQTVRVTTPGDSPATDSHTETTYSYATCTSGAAAGSGCTSAMEFMSSFRGLPVLTEVFSGATTTAPAPPSNIYLSTTHHSYQATTTGTAMDGDVRFGVYAWEAQTDTYLYDTSAFGAQSYVVNIPDVSSNLYVASPGFTVRDTTGVAHTQTTQTMGPFNQVSTVTDHGRGKTDDVLAYDGPLEAPPTDRTVGWILRPKTSAISGTSPLGAAEQGRSLSFGYDLWGNLTDIYAPVTIVGSLNRSATYGAPAPTGASAVGTAHMAHITYDAPGTGNVLTIERYPGATNGDASSRCTKFSYDGVYSHWKTAEQAFNGSCSAQTFAFTEHAYDTVVERETWTTGSDGQTWKAQFDEFGRMTSLLLPSSTDASFGATGPANIQVVYSDQTYGALVATTETSSDFRAHATYDYRDGFGRRIATTTSTDPSESAPWIVSGLVGRNAKGLVTAAYYPWYYNVAEPSITAPPGPVPPSGTPIARKSYDAFSRTLQTFDIDNTITSSMTYHALSTDVRDAENLKANGSHLHAFKTVNRDGHGRVGSVVETGNGGSITTQVSYLPTGERTSIFRSGTTFTGIANVAVSYSRSMVYDSLGRMISNQEPNSGTWNYVYDDVGDLLGTSDARGCGENMTYDGLGRVLTEDYSPCLAPPQQMAYTPITDTVGTGTEAFYSYETAFAFVTGHLVREQDRAASVQYQYDLRGRVSSVSKQVAKPGDPDASLATRYASNVFSTSLTYDDWGRVLSQSTGATSPELLAPTSSGEAIGPSVVTATYSRRGLLQSVQGSYGTLIANRAVAVDGLPTSVTYGDVAHTTTAFTYDDPRHRLTEVKTSRLASGFLHAQGSYTPPVVGGDQNTLQTVLTDDVIAVTGSSGTAPGYDAVGNPLQINDRRLPGEWGVGSQPVSRYFAYDDDYRVTAATYISGNGASGGDAFTPPLAANMRSTSPFPLLWPAHRAVTQSFNYDGLGNTVATSDDAQVFFDRSLGTITNGGNGAGPNQLTSAVLAGAGFGGVLNATYDPAGNLTEIQLNRLGKCTSATGCSPLLRYDWDEVGRLARARRYDTLDQQCVELCIRHGACTTKCGESGPNAYPYPSLPQVPPAVDVAYAYDAGGARVLRESNPNDASSAPTVFSVEVFSTLRLNETGWDGERYVVNAETEGVYLMLGGKSFGRVVNAPKSPTVYSPAGATTSAAQYQHVFLELGDGLSSTSVVIDKATSELVERTTYLAYGAVDSDYRPDRWEDFREDYQWTGKEQDVELGIVYFGARYYSPHLGRWLSTDPLTIHGVAGDLNPYAYVRGRVTTFVDPNGLCGSAPPGGGSGGGGGGTKGGGGGGASPPPVQDPPEQPEPGEPGEDSGSRIRTLAGECGTPAPKPTPNVRGAQYDVVAAGAVAGVPVPAPGTTGGPDASGVRLRVLEEGAETVLATAEGVTLAEVAGATAGVAGGAVAGVVVCTSAAGCAVATWALLQDGVPDDESDHEGGAPLAGAGGEEPPDEPPDAISRRLGREGEQRVREKFDIGEKVRIDVDGRTRIPDGLTRTTLNEVKNVAQQAFTQQLRDFLQYAQANGLAFHLWVRSGTLLSAALQAEVLSGAITLRYIP